MTIDEISDRIAIGETKARYCRFLDTKQWDAWASLFTEDLVLDTSEAGGPPPIEGRDAAIAASRAVIETARTAHQVHAPEIVLDGDSAQVVWAMQDRVVFDDGTSPEAETCLLAARRERGLRGVALCVANTHGPQDYQPTPHNGRLWQGASGRQKAAVDVGQPTVDIRDVAEAALLAERYARAGERYIVANEFVSARDFYALAVAGRGQAMPRLIPYRVPYGSAWVVERGMRLLRRKDNVVSTDAIYLSNVFGEMDNSKARRELQWTPRPLRETVCDAVDWFAAREGAAA